jgi:hypothetical protein
MRRTTVVIGVCVAVLAVSTSAQGPADRPAFEVASIKPSKAENATNNLGQRGENVATSAFSLRMLLGSAYNLDLNQAGQEIFGLFTPVLTFASQQPQDPSVLATSDLIDYGRAIARDKGYDVSKTEVYSFSIPSQGFFAEGYTTVALEVYARGSLIFLINNATGQAVEFNSCEVYEYPDLKRWQQRSLEASKAKPKTPQELADEVRCDVAPKVLTKPVPVRKLK